jgi:hypothetical protein
MHISFHCVKCLIDIVSYEHLPCFISLGCKVSLLSVLRFHFDEHCEISCLGCVEEHSLLVASHLAHYRISY